MPKRRTRGEFDIHDFQADPLTYREKFSSQELIDAERAERKVLKKRLGYVALTLVAGVGIYVGVESFIDNKGIAIFTAFTGALAIGWLFEQIKKRAPNRPDRR